MAPKDSSARFHPYDTNKKPKIHRTNNYSNSNSNSKKKTSNDTSQKSGSGLSINDLKRRIRDVKRLLSRADLVPEARIIQERALMGYERDLKEEQERRQRSEMIKKYHFVRFLDRKAATKELRTAQRRLEKIKGQEGSSSAELAKLQTEIDIAQINVNYTIYYPLTEKYISLYPQNKKQQKQHSDDDGSNNENNTDDEIQTHSTGEKPPMWHIVQKCTSENTLEKLRDGKLNTESSVASGDAVKSSSSGGSKGDDKEKKKKKDKDTAESRHHRHHKKEPVQEEEEDSDGGFFEE